LKAQVLRVHFICRQAKESSMDLHRTKAGGDRSNFTKVA